VPLNGQTKAAATIPLVKQRSANGLHQGVLDKTFLKCSRVRKSIDAKGGG
jgi:hypothetical protein